MHLAAARELCEGNKSRSSFHVGLSAINTATENNEANKDRRVLKSPPDRLVGVV